ncbi:MAG: adenylate/guanylate cyclase domain-containing protein [Gammaproteobacteria bacterium]|nr:adenylate/guanylate cyclase domain-containing protein [Gammaproteobacteria bacterium]
MSPADNEVTIMFADIVGSTRLYELLGDEAAEKLVTTTLRQLSDIAGKSQGVTIKFSGDDILCHFSKVDQALNAAREMHMFLAARTAAFRDYKIAIRIGAHQGPVIESEGDIYGDAVNLAARVAALARSGKTVISGYTFEQLSDASSKRCRRFTITTGKGKELPIDVYDVVWEQTDELTRIVGNDVVTAIQSILTIRYEDNIIKMFANTITSIMVGRGQDCDLIIPSQQASREHCKVECNRGKFILVDNSANGSYVKHDQTELFFHQERVPLLGEGYISLGEPSADNPEFLLHYSIERIGNNQVNPAQ